jgi:hypothetical protein
MENVVSKYLDGNVYAKDILIEDIMELHDYNISKEEAEVLLHKKYGKA